MPPPTLSLLRQLHTTTTSMPSQICISQHLYCLYRALSCICLPIVLATLIWVGGLAYLGGKKMESMMRLMDEMKEVLNEEGKEQERII